MKTASPWDQAVEEAVAKVHRHESVRKALPGGGVLSLDRNLPYLLAYRRPEGLDDRGTERLITGEAAYLIVGAGADGPDAAEMIRRIAEAGSSEYGAFLVLEIWSAETKTAWFTIKCPRGAAQVTVATLVTGLQGLTEIHPEVEVAVEATDDRHPPGMSPLLSIRESWDIGCLLLGLEVPPIYRDPSDRGAVYPVFLRRLKDRLSKTLRQSIYEFIRVQTSYDVDNYHALGTRSLDPSVWDADRELSAIERSYSFLLLVSPVNNDAGWAEFKRTGYERNPQFHYRLLPVDPDLLKRRLFGIELEQIDDPALAYLLRDKREELDKQISMLEERGSDQFRYSSLRLFGEADEALVGLAGELLQSLPAAGAVDKKRTAWVDATAFAAAARQEFAHYAEIYPDFSNHIEIRPDLVGLMVSEGNLLIGEGLRLSPGRVDALLQHEVGTHVLTYANGSAQPLGQLALGLADYDELQEGLAVLAEALVGGLDRFRMRLLAARVVAAHAMLGGADFVETFRLLTDTHGLTRGSAWGVATRVHQCGGFTRDIIYLRGLVRLLDHLERGGALEPLYVGKIAAKHIPVMEELAHRGVLRTPPLTPRFLERPEARERLEAVRRGITLTELVRPESE